MKVYPTMLLKTNGENMSESRYATMLLKIIDL
jgi:hypothetical protein